VHCTAEPHTGSLHFLDQSFTQQKHSTRRPQTVHCRAHLHVLK